MLDLHNLGHSVSEIADIIFETDNNEKFTRDQLRRKIRRILKVHKTSLNSEKENLNRFKSENPDIYEALLEECETAGLDINLVNHFWYKSENFSINMSSARKTNDEILKDFISSVSKIVKNIKAEADTSVWDNVYKAKTFQLESYSDEKSGKLLVPSIFDLHLGKLADFDETGEEYNYKIAIERFNNAIDDLIQKTISFNPERILFPVGNDLFNSDKAFPYSQTTAGTPQHDDLRWQKMFVLGRQLISNAITKLSVIAPVDVVTVFSNHDHERVFYLGDVLEAVFSNNERVTVDNSPKGRKYYQWGKCMIGLAHGHNEAVDRLPLLMAQEQPKMWAETYYREWLLGHLHHKKKYMTEQTKDYNGVIVTFLSSLSATDAWHYSKAFSGSIKSAEAFVYDKIHGHVGTAVHSIYNEMTA
ncbi:gp163 [Sphingomonas phage PAU]|uniref:DNA repair exonuclease n=1 Tax=Sphingomonas phage PAU TaxID=1150991 RepID=UPI00025732EF|nr:DNA repair exonuclease [Sphingomonas phage PAU]AFF28161.1 gp163 [Sphingomonas phage PAU]